MVEPIRFGSGAGLAAGAANGAVQRRLQHERSSRNSAGLFAGQDFGINRVAPELRGYVDHADVYSRLRDRGQ